MSPREYLSALLDTRLEIVEAREHEFAPGWHEPDVHVNASRLIFALEGHLPYVIDDTEHTLRAGGGLLVPTGVRRRWRVPEDTPCRLLWFRYAMPESAEPVLPHALISRRHDHDAVYRGVRRVIALFAQPTPMSTLAGQAEAKAVLARFLASARPLRGHKAVPTAETPGDIAVNYAVAFLNHHFAQSDAVQAMHRQVELSPAYFRKLFRRQMGCSPREFLTRRRMQDARFRLLSGHGNVKKVAADVGYNDPLYFSKLYTRHWGHSPSEDDRRRW
ncbi:MAG: AraC family transcriptional regulator [Planctomycetota bacterium]